MLSTADHIQVSQLFELQFWVERGAGPCAIASVPPARFRDVFFFFFFDAV